MRPNILYCLLLLAFAIIFSFLTHATRAQYAAGLNVHGMAGVPDDGNGYLSIPTFIPLLTTCNITQVAAGFDHSLFLCGDTGLVYSVGANAFGELAIGDDFPREEPVQIQSYPPAGGLEVSMIAAGMHTSFFVTGTSQLWASGDNSVSQICLPSVYEKILHPMQVGDIAPGNITQISVGYDHVLILFDHGGIVTCGNNSHGALGLGSNSLPWGGPIALQPLPEISAVAAGNGFSVILDIDGGAHFFGNNLYGVAGLGHTETPIYSLTRIPGPLYTAIAAGWSHVVLLDSDSNAWTMGDGRMWDLGLTEGEGIYSDRKLIGVSLSKIHAGPQSTFLEPFNQNIFWVAGENLYGSLGLGTTEPVRAFVSAKKAATMDSITTVSAGAHHTLFLANSFLCFGEPHWLACSTRGTCVGTDVCVCNPIHYTGDWCDVPICLGRNASDSEVCTSHGQCTYPDVCICEEGYTGSTCNLPICNGLDASNINSCSGNGVCVEPSVCHCNALYGGANCSHPRCNSILSHETSVCSGRGNCTAPNHCSCSDNFQGENCEFHHCFGILSNSTAVCSGNGLCVDVDTCICAEGYTGAYCSQTECFSKAATDISVCSDGHGICIAPDVCSCHPGYSGIECGNFSCFGISMNSSDVCGSHGTCTSHDTCLCDQGYADLDCKPECFGETSPEAACSSHGSCVAPDECSCSEGFSTSDCSVPVCFGFNAHNDYVCSRRGECATVNECICDDGYDGDNCQHQYCFGILSNETSVCSGSGACLFPDSCSCTSFRTGTQCQHFSPNVTTRTQNIVSTCSDITIVAFSEDNQYPLSFEWILEDTSNVGHPYVVDPNLVAFFQKQNQSVLRIPHSMLVDPSYFIGLSASYILPTTGEKVTSFRRMHLIQRVNSSFPVLSSPHGEFDVAAGNSITIGITYSLPDVNCPFEFNSSLISFDWFVFPPRLGFVINTIYHDESTITAELRVPLLERRVMARFSMTYDRSTTGLIFPINVYKKPIETHVHNHVQEMLPLSNVILDASRSFDPHGDIDGPLYFEWSCEYQPQDSPPMLFDISTFNSSVLTVHLPTFFQLSALLADNSWLGVYAFKVTARKGNRGSTSAIVSIKVVEQLAHYAVHIDRLGASTLDLGERVGFRCSLESRSDALISQSVRFDWGISGSKWNTTSDNFISFGQSGILRRNTSDTSLLIVAENQFAFGDKYTIHARAFDEFNQVLASAQYVLDLSNRPEGGEIFVQPASGRPLETVFTALTIGWTGSGSLQYMYSYSIINSDGSVASEEIVLRPFSSEIAFHFPISLPNEQIDPSEESTVQVMVRATARDQTTGSTNSAVFVISLDTSTSNNDTILVARAEELLSASIDSTQKMSLMSSFSSILSPSSSSTSDSLRGSMLQSLDKLTGSSNDTSAERHMQTARILTAITNKPTTVGISSGSLAVQIVEREVKKGKDTLVGSIVDSYTRVCSNVVHGLAMQSISEQQTDDMITQIDQVTNTIVQTLYSQQFAGEQVRVIQSEFINLGVVRVQRSEWDHGTTVQDIPEGNATFSVELPSDLFGDSSTEDIGVQFKSVKQNAFHARTNVSSNILSLTLLTGSEIFSPPAFNHSIQFSLFGSFNFSAQEGKMVPLCQYFDTQNRSWSSRGVHMVNFTHNRIDCVTNHTTDFGVLLEYFPAPNVLDFNFITGKDSIINLNSDNFTTTILVFCIWVLYFAGLMILEGWYTASWYIREWRQQHPKPEKVMKVGAIVDGKRRYIRPMFQKFRDLHLWLSVLLLPSVEHQNSSRSQRLTLLMMLLLGIGLSNAMSAGIDSELVYWSTCLMADAIVMPFVGFAWFLFSKVKPRETHNVDSEPSSGQNGSIVSAKQHCANQKKVWECSPVHACQLSGQIDKKEFSNISSSASPSDDGFMEVKKSSSFTQRITNVFQESMKSVNTNKLELIDKMDNKIDAVVRLFGKIDVRVTGSILLVVGTLIYFSLIAAGSYVILLVQWLGPIGTSILVVGSTISYFGIATELYLQSKTRAFKKGKISWVTRWTGINIALSSLFIVGVLILGGASIFVVMSRDERDLDRSLRLGISTVIGVFMLGMVSVTLRWIYKNLRTPRIFKKRSKMRRKLEGYWFPWWFKAVVYMLCWILMIIASWLLIMYGIKFSREGVEGDFFFALICASNQNAWLDNPSGIILSTLVATIMMKLCQALFFPADHIIGDNPIGGEGDDDEIYPVEQIAVEVPTLRVAKVQGLKKKHDIEKEIGNGDLSAREEFVNIRSAHRTPQ